MTSLRRRVAVTVIVLVVLVLGTVGVQRRGGQLDLTAGKSLTLSSETKRIVRRLKAKVQVTAVLRNSDPNRVPTASLLARYNRLNRRITYRLVDPDLAPGVVDRVGVDPVEGGLAIQQGAQIEHSSTTSEQDITAGLARLIRGRTAELCATAGHGERDVAGSGSDGLASASALLKSNGYSIRTVDLLADPVIPPTCGGLLIANPTAPLGAAGDAIAAYLKANGRAVILVDPTSAVDLNPILAPYGLVLARGLVEEADDADRLPGDPVTPVVRRYESTSPVVRRLPPAFFPGVEGIGVTTNAERGLSAIPLARSSASSFLERKPANVHFDPSEGDLPGPINLVASADLSSNAGSSIDRTRVVLTADVDFATNGFLDQGGNSQLLVQAVDWATLQGDLVAVSSHVAALRSLDLTDARIRYARLLTAVLVPLLFLLIGAFIWALRRTR